MSLRIVLTVWTRYWACSALTVMYYILGDFNADPDSDGGPHATTNVNEQSHILLRYLRKWEYISTHLQQPSLILHPYMIHM